MSKKKSSEPSAQASMSPRACSEACVSPLPSKQLLLNSSENKGVSTSSRDERPDNFRYSA